MKLFDVIKKAKALLSTVKLTQEPLTDGSLIQYDGDAISTNEVVYLMSGADNWSVLPDGSYITKAQTNFTIAEGVVTSVKPGNTPKVENTPVLQAQSSQEETAKTEISTTEPTVEVTEEVKLADATVTVDINDVIQAALAPVYQSIADIQSAISNLAQLYVSQDSFKKTEQAMSKIADVVSVLANEPAGKPIEVELNSIKPVAKEFKDTQTYKIFNSNTLSK